MRLAHLASASCLTLLISFPFDYVSANSVNWPQAGLTSGHGADNTAETVLGAGNVASLAPTWQLATGAQTVVPPVEAGGRVFAVSGDGDLYAANAVTGAPLWTFNTGSTPGAAGLVVSGNLVIADCQVGPNTGGVPYPGHGGLCAVNARTGASVWSWTISEELGEPVGSGVLSAPTLAGGLVFVQEGIDYNNTPGFFIYALNASNGAVVWSAGTCGDNGYATGCGGGAASTPFAVDRGQLFYNARLTYPPSAYDQWGVCARVAATGQGSEWCFPVQDGTLALTAANQKVLFASRSYDGTSTTFTAIEQASGAQAWATTVAMQGNGAHFAPAVADGIAYFSEDLTGNGAYGLYAFSLGTGRALWSYTPGQNGNQLVSGPSVANGVVYADTPSGPYAFDAKTGRVLLALANHVGASHATPLVANGAVVGGCFNNDICGYAPAP
jgi:outer membrane protein assembly factor BamB